MCIFFFFFCFFLLFWYGSDKAALSGLVGYVCPVPHLLSERRVASCDAGDRKDDAAHSPSDSSHLSFLTKDASSSSSFFLLWFLTHPRQFVHPSPFSDVVVSLVMMPLPSLVIQSAERRGMVVRLSRSCWNVGIISFHNVAYSQTMS